jgi:uncharacterized protein
MQPPRTVRAEVIVNGDDVYEDLLGVSGAVLDIAARAGLATTRVLGAGRFLRRGQDVDVYVLCTATGSFSMRAQEALSQLVANGVGVLALHASNVFSDGAEGTAQRGGPLHQLVGSRFVSHGPPPHSSRFRAHFCGRHPLTKGLHDFYVDHEHYVVEVASDATVLATRAAPDGPQPLLYVRTHGKGRVCYLQLGHDVRSLDEPPVRSLCARALWWCTGLVGREAQAKGRHDRRGDGLKVGSS